jgi:Lrp/AsnC family transcriptional regulator for asnA, asnC and gidA
MDRQTSRKPEIDVKRERAARARARGDSPYDDFDRRIIALLEKDGRMSNIEIAQRLGVTEATVRKRVARLLDEKLIKIVAVPDPVSLGMTTSAIMGISVDLKELNAVAEALIALPETRYVGYSTGQYDLIIEAFFPTNDALLQFLAEKISKISGITGTETSVILRVSKFAYEWEVPEEAMVR